MRCAVVNYESKILFLLHLFITTKQPIVEYFLHHPSLLICLVINGQIFDIFKAPWLQVFFNLSVPVHLDHSRTITSASIFFSPLQFSTLKNIVFFFFLDSTDRTNQFHLHFTYHRKNKFFHLLFFLAVSMIRRLNWS